MINKDTNEDRLLLQPFMLGNLELSPNRVW